MRRSAEARCTVPGFTLVELLTDGAGNISPKANNAGGCT